MSLSVVFLHKFWSTISRIHHQFEEFRQNSYEEDHFVEPFHSLVVVMMMKADFGSKDVSGAGSRENENWGEKKKRDWN